ncbi:MAG TPA: PEP-CTERM sorting domain-containing protein [Bryobacteraceae bacterium]|nr:PEP-CTERM sorting domain-containing protein [Bryobacteraceae bacterium]
MKTSRLAAFLPLMLACGTAFASTITLGSIATNDIAVFGFDSGFPSTSSVNVVNSGSHIDVTGNVVSPVVTNAAGLTFTAGSGTATPTTTEENDLASVVTQLNALSYTSDTITSGATNVISTPGDYTINGVLGANTVIDLTGPGPYVFKTSGNLDLTNVTINDENASLSSDDVFWYTTGTVDIENSKVFGDVVQASGANNILETASAGGTLSGSLTGRFLSEGFTTGLTAVQASTLTINAFQAGDTPEPTTFALVFLGFAGLAAKVRRRR